MFKKIIMTLATTTLVASPIVTAQAQAAPHRQEVTRTVVKHRPHGRTVVKQKTTVRKAPPAAGRRVSVSTAAMPPIIAS